MCRIAGITSRELTTRQLQDKVHIMCRALRHGGPDDEGFFVDEHEGLVFGHRRLSIIDLSEKGHQPMADITQKAWITFNGEIYNYLELKEQLRAKGVTFYTNTDTEVILQAYLHWGISSFCKLRGMFAFALFDKAKATTYLVRDTNGIKPLYYHIANKQLSFASEVRALKDAGIATTDDDGWRVKLLAFGNIPEPYTTLKNVWSLPKGNFLTWDHVSETYLINTYNTTLPVGEITNKITAEEAINHAVTLAVKRQLISDAPIGVFLSGGIDSSLLTILADQQKEQQLKTVSIFFDEKTYDERLYQDIVIKGISGEKFSHLVKQSDFDESLPQILKAMDMPTTDGVNSWFISNYAHKDGLKAVLSGIGADELFGGYPSFRRIAYLGYLRNLPAMFFEPAKYFAADRYKKISFLAHRHYMADYLLLRGLFVPTDIAKILDADISEINNILFGTVANIDLGKYDGAKASWFESNLYMQNQLLRDTDVMSMSHGLEVRVPFLDEDLRQIVNSISPEIRFSNTQPKKLLTDSFKGIIPPAVVNRPKMGFSFPLQQWMSEHREISDSSLYAGQEAKNLVKKFKNNNVHWSKIFALYQVQQYA